MLALRLQNALFPIETLSSRSSAVQSVATGLDCQKRLWSRQLIEISYTHL